MRQAWTRMSLAALSLVGCIGANVVAGTTVYTEEASFVGGLAPGWYEEDFSSLENAAGEIARSANGFGYTVSAADGAFVGGDDLSLSTDQPGAALFVEFTGNPVFALGGNFWLTDFFFDTTTGMLLLDLADGFATQETLTDAGPSTFRGFISTSPIASLTLTPPGTGNVYATLDNFYVGGAAVPTPGAVVLGALGTILVGCLRRRRIV